MTQKTFELKLNRSSLNMLLVIIVIVVSDDTLLFGTNRNSTFETLKYIILIGTLIILSASLLKILNIRQISYARVSYVILCILVLLSGIINEDLRTGYFYKCIILILSFKITEKMSLQDFAQKFEKVIFVLAFVSMICTLIAEVNLAIFSVFPVFFNSANTSFYNMGLYMVPTSAQLLRNYGIFREPGVYQMFLMIALLFHLYFSDELKKSHIVVFISSIVLTFSTTGYIALAFFLVLFLIKKNESFTDNKKKYFIVLLMIVGIIYMITQTDLLSSNGMVFDKLSNTKRTTTIARMSSIFVNLEIWKKSPIFGAGLISVSEMFPSLTYQLYGKAITHNTNTLLCELSTYGVIYTAVLIYGYVKFSKAMSEKFMERLMILLIVFILSCGEKMTFSPIIYILMFYGISFKKKNQGNLFDINDV